MVFRIKKLGVSFIVTLFTITTFLLLVSGASHSNTYDTNAGTIVEIEAILDSIKPTDGLNEIEIRINLIELNAEALSLFDVEVEIKMGTLFSNTEVFDDNLTTVGQNLNTSSSFEYNSNWGNVDLEVRIRFNQLRQLVDRPVIDPFESEWFFFFSIRPRTFLDDNLWVILTGGCGAIAVAGTSLFFRGRLRSKVKIKQVPKKSKNLFLKFLEQANANQTREYKKTWKEFVVSLHKVNPNITSKSVHRLSTEMLHNTLGDMSQEIMLKLQITMDRRQKVIQTLSNILKKISSTSDTIISNLK